VGSRGEAPVGGLGDFVPQKLKHFSYISGEFSSFRVTQMQLCLLVLNSSSMITDRECHTMCVGLYVVEMTKHV
jgi:hypothetical protein